MTNCVSRCHALEHVGEAAHVGLVERRIDFVEYAEGTGLVLEDADQQRQRGEGLFAAGEQQHVLQFLARAAATTMSMPLSMVFSSSVRRMKAWPPPKSLREGDAEVLVDANEGFVELGARDLVDLLDGGLGVFDGVEQVFALRARGTRGAARSRCTPRAPSC